MQSNHPVGDEMRSKSASMRLPSDMCLFRDVVFVTVLMKVTSLEEVKENFPCLELLPLQTGHSHVVLLLFGMRFRLMHSK